jgi:tetratricopeptide (TPR) repeat protein
MPAGAISFDERGRNSPGRGALMNKMTLVGAIFAGAAFAGVPAFAQSNYGGQSVPQQSAAQPPAESSSAIKTHTPKVSRGAAKAIQSLQSAVNANDAAAIAATLPAAQAAASTPDDKYIIGILQLKAAAASKNDAGIAAAIEAMLASGSVTADEKFPLYLHLAQTYSNLKQNDRAIQAYQQALQVNPNSVDATAGLAETMAAAGQPAQAIAMLQKGIQLQSAGGAKAPESWYKRTVAIAYKAKLPQAVALARDWVKAYPSADSWTNALSIYQLGAQLDEAATLDLMRLKRATGALTPSDYFNYGDIAVRKGFSGEAKSVLDQGFSANLIKRSDPSFSQLYALASQKTKGDRESLPAAPGASSTGKQLVTTGDAWFGYGDYAKAADFYRAALAKGDADKNLVNLHLGMALARQGDKAGATAALNAVGGREAELAKFWLSYVSSKA